MSTDRTIVIDTPDGIKFASYASIAAALRIQVRTGLKSRGNAHPAAAREILRGAGKDAPKRIDLLSIAFEAHRRELWPSVFTSTHGK